MLYIWRVSMTQQSNPKSNYDTAPEENLPPNSILSKVKISSKIKPPPHLMRIFNTYLENEKNYPNCEEIDFAEFGTKWLPLFNYGAHEDQKDIPIMDWVEQVSLNPYRPVKLMNWVDGQYVCVAIIPPIFDNNVQLLREDERDYFMQLATREAHKLQGVHRTSQANGYISRNITDRIEVRRRVLTDHFHKMNEIFKLYGVEREIPQWLVDNSNGELAPVVKDETTPSTFSSGMIEED